ncbi:MAG: proline--tRNA ligase [Actinobacteria bacterium]|nr:proline--tRNA ligase [Actinomycetota bacterium]
MRMTSLFLRTLRDDPTDAEVESHRLLVRAGCIRKVASGVYSWLPLGSRVLRRVEQIVREEMDAAGAQEVILPIAQPLELWERSGRDAAYGPLMFRLQDRKETGFCLSPTAEEVVTTTVAAEYSSYRDLPVNLYQVNWKYRDELRPRFGLLRAREFLMKDAYSFDVDVEGLGVSYQEMYDAYHRVFTRCGLTFRSVEGEAGEIGGDVNHEFMAVAAVGEDDFVWCKQCDYAANVEVARRSAEHPAHHAVVPAADAAPVEKVHTPQLPGIAGVAEHLGAAASELLKCIAFDVDGELGLALVPGDREVNEFALARAVTPRKARLYTDDDFAARPALPKGYIGPGYEGAVLVVADPSVRAPRGWITGANEVDHHVRHVRLDRDFRVDVWADLVTIVSGDPCPNCSGPLSVDRGIEVGQVFQLGTKYARALGAFYTDERGDQHPMVMGCYGIGISRVVAAVVEEHHDEHGIAWPAALAPFDVHLVVLPGKGDAADEVRRTADALYDALRGAGLEVLYDDRDASPGVKFADADLLGMPVQLTLGAKGLARGIVERKVRASGERNELALTDDVLTVGPGELRAAVGARDAWSG